MSHPPLPVSLKEEDGEKGCIIYMLLFLVLLFLLLLPLFLFLFLHLPLFLLLCLIILTHLLLLLLSYNIPIIIFLLLLIPHSSPLLQPPLFHQSSATVNHTCQHNAHLLLSQTTVSGDCQGTTNSQANQVKKVQPQERVMPSVWHANLYCERQGAGPDGHIQAEH